MKSEQIILEDRSEVVRREIERESRYLASLWKQFRFKGNPPISGSPVERRLKETCNAYANIATNGGLTRADITGASSSEARRRELHNQIALMVSGAQRSDMSHSAAREIADFAIRFSTGMTLEEIEMEK